MAEKNCALLAWPGMLTSARATRTVNAVSKAKSYLELRLIWVWAVFCHNYVPPQRGFVGVLQRSM